MHGTTGMAPAERFAQEAGALRPLGGRAPFGQLRDLVRKVQADCPVDLDTNSYSVPKRLIGQSVQVVVLGGRVVVRHTPGNNNVSPGKDNPGSSSKLGTGNTGSVKVSDSGADGKPGGTSGPGSNGGFSSKPSNSGSGGIGSDTGASAKNGDSYNGGSGSKGGSSGGGLISPAMVDLNVDGVSDVRPFDPVARDGAGDAKRPPQFDWDVDGIADVTAWIGPKDGLLVIDLGPGGSPEPDRGIDQPQEIAVSLRKPKRKVKPN